MSNGRVGSKARPPESERPSEATREYGIAREPGGLAPPLAPGRPPEDGVVSRAEYPDVTVGDGYAIGTIDQFGEGEGFRKVRPGLGVTAFGVNALVRPAGYETKWHRHDLQEELYFVHQGTIEMRFADGAAHRLGPGAFARVDAATARSIRILGPGETIYLCIGGKDGYVGLDGQATEPPR